jgi:hypothetical protein
MAPKVTQDQVTETINAVQWTAHGDDVEAAAVTRRRARQCGPDCIALLHHVVRSDNFASITQRVRASIALLEAGEFLTPEAKATDLFREPEGSGAADGHPAS